MNTHSNSQSSLQENNAGRQRLFQRLLILAVALVSTASLRVASAKDDDDHGFNGINPSFGHGHPSFAFDWDNLVSDLDGVARRTDPYLVNPWGIAARAKGTFYVVDNGTGVATAYDRNGAPLMVNPQTQLIIKIPPPTGGTDPSAPTGVVSNPRNDFNITANNKTGRSVLIFVTEDGTISAWNPDVDPNALLVVNNFGADAIYKGAAMGTTTDGSHILYVANFHAGLIETYDSGFLNVSATKFAGKFVDPNPVVGYAPFNIANILGSIYVTFAQQDATAEDDVKGPGHGFINVYDTDGNFVKRLVPLDPNGPLNSPWGLAHANKGYGRLHGALLVGNFGDGRINAFDLKTGAYLATLEKKKKDGGGPLAFDGLWAIVFQRQDDPTRDWESDSHMLPDLYFSAGLADEAHGLFGEISHGEGP